MWFKKWDNLSCDHVMSLWNICMSVGIIDPRWIEINVWNVRLLSQTKILDTQVTKPADLCYQYHLTFFPQFANPLHSNCFIQIVYLPSILTTLATHIWLGLVGLAASSICPITNWWGGDFYNTSNKILVTHFKSLLIQCDPTLNLKEYEHLDYKIWKFSKNITLY